MPRRPREKSNQLQSLSTSSTASDDYYLDPSHWITQEWHSKHDHGDFQRGRSFAKSLSSRTTRTERTNHASRKFQKQKTTSSPVLSSSQHMQASGSLRFTEDDKEEGEEEEAEDKQIISMNTSMGVQSHASYEQQRYLNKQESEGDEDESLSFESEGTSTISTSDEDNLNGSANNNNNNNKKKKNGDRDPTETTEQADSASGGSISIPSSWNQLETVQKELAEIEKKLNQNQLKLTGSTGNGALRHEEARRLADQIHTEKKRNSLAEKEEATRIIREAIKERALLELSQDPHFDGNTILIAGRSNNNEALQGRRRRSTSAISVSNILKFKANEELSASTNKLQNWDRGDHSVSSSFVKNKNNEAITTHNMQTSPLTEAEADEDLSVLTTEGSNVAKDQIQEDQGTLNIKRSSDRRRRKSGQDVLRNTDAAKSLSNLLDSVISSSDGWSKAMEKTPTANECHYSAAQLVVKQLERMLDCFVKLADSLELLISFGTPAHSSSDSSGTNFQNTIECISDNFAPLLEFLWIQQLYDILNQYWERDPEEQKLLDQLHRIALVLKTLSIVFKDLFFIHKRHPTDLVMDPNIKTVFVTLFELLRRETWALTVVADKSKDLAGEISRFRPSVMLQLAWNDGDSNDWRDLFRSTDSWDGGMQRFRRICYYCLLSSNLLSPNAMEILKEYGDRENFVLRRNRCLACPVPGIAKILLQGIKGNPLKREKLMDRIVSELLRAEISDSDRLPVVALTGSCCVGKTTMATLVAHKRAVRELYCDGIVWIRFSITSMSRLTFNQYISLLQQVKMQLDISEDGLSFHFSDYMPVPGETLVQQQMREQRLMGLAKSRMKDLLHDRRVLIILDDIRNLRDFEWFNFFEESPSIPKALLLTTRRQDIVPGISTIEVDALCSAEESLELLVQESDLHEEWDSNPSDEEPAAAISMAYKCLFHPMAMALLGRYLHLQGQQPEMNGKMTLTPTEKVLPIFNRDEGHKMLYEIIDMVLVPVTDAISSTMLKVCLVAFVKTFCEIKDFLSCISAGPELLPAVPVELIEILFESALRLEKTCLQSKCDEVHEDMEHQTDLVLYSLCTLGVLSDPVENNGRVHLVNPLYQEYVTSLLNEDALIAQLAQESKDWHASLVSKVMTMGCDCYPNYNAHMLPAHMLHGELYIEAGDFLANKKFIQQRVTELGIEEATWLHIRDLNNLMTTILPSSTIERKKSRAYYKVVTQQAYCALLEVMSENKKAQHDTSSCIRAMLDIGNSFSEWYCWEDAICFWEKGLSIFSPNETDRAAILLRVGASHLAMSNYRKALASFDDCLNIRKKSFGGEHVLCAEVLMKIAEVHLQANDNTKAQRSYERAIYILQKHTSDNHKFIRMQTMLFRDKLDRRTLKEPLKSENNDK